MSNVLNMVGGGGGAPYATIGVWYPEGEICECSNGVDTMQSKPSVFSGAVAKFHSFEPTPLNGIKVDITPVQSGSGTPAYDNVRPIAGWSNAKITRTGKNLIKVTADTIANSQNCTFTLTDSGLTLTATGNYARRMDSFSVETGKTYTLSFRGSSTGNLNTVYVCKSESYNLSERYITKTLDATDKIYTYTFTATTNVLAIAWYCTAESNTGAMTISNLQLEEGSSDTPFEAYQGNTYTIDLDGTRYGGTLNVTTGVLTIDREFIELDGNSNVSRTGSGSTQPTEVLPYWATVEIPATPKSDYNYDNWMFSHGILTAAAYAGIFRLYYQSNTSIRIVIGTTSHCSTTALVKSWLQEQYDLGSPLQVVYELATPFTVQLTAEQIDTLVGDNVIWADTGDISVEYMNGYWVFAIKKKGTWTVTCGEDSESVVVSQKGQVNIVDFVSGEAAINAIGYSGNTRIIENDSKIWEVALLTSGTLNVYKQVAVDIFLCGGGGGGGRGGYGGGLGGGGGYTKNLFNIILEKGTYAVAIGGGGAGGTGSGASGDGGTSSITGVDGASANGGSGVAAGGSGAGGNGGSGGGGGTSNTKGAGGSNGSGGAGGSTGQEMSTYAYLDSTDTLYAGGGGGGTRLSDGSAGGAGGGADGGGSNSTGSSAAMNTGGGGGGGGGKDSSPYMAGGNGGSGIIRIRTHR